MTENEPERKPSVPPAKDSAERELPSSAADDPTAMWDEGELRAAGMDEVADRAKSLPPAAATGPDVKGDVRQSVVVGDEKPGASPQAQQAAPRPRPRRSADATGGLSWPITIGLAIALGLAVYFLVKLLR